MEWRILLTLVLTHSAYSQYAVVPELAPPPFLPSELTSGVSIPQIPGVAGVDYPIFSQSLVTSSFHCSEATPPGYYPDFESKCQLFHVCQEEIDQSTFICPNGTVFNDKHSVCDWWFNVQCAQPLAPVVQPYDYPTPAPLQDNYNSAPIQVENGNGRRMKNQHRTNRLRMGFSRNEAIAQTYGAPLEATPIPEVQEVEEEIVAVVESQGYNSQSGVSNGSGRRMRNQQRRNRLRSGILRNEAIVQSYGGPLEPTPVPEVEEIVEEVAAVVENHSYNGQSTINNNNGRRNQQRFNSFRTQFSRNEDVGQSYGSPLAPAPIQNSYHEQLPETVTEVGEVQEEVLSPLDNQEQSIAAEENGRRMRFQQRNNRFRLRNEPIVQSYGGPLIPPPAPIQSSYHQTLPQTTPVIVEAEEEVSPAALESHGYNGPSTSGVENGRRMKSQRGNNQFRSSFFRNEPTKEIYGGPLVLPPAPTAIESVEEEGAAPLETQGYNGHPVTNVENGRSAKLRGNRMRTSFVRNGAIVQNYGGPLVSPPAPIQNAYHQEIIPETTPAAIELEDTSAPLEAQGYNKQPSSAAENGRRMRNQQKNNRLRFGTLRNEPATQTYGGPLVAVPAPIQSSYHQALPETTPVAVEEEEQVASLEAQGYNSHPVTNAAEIGRRLRNQQRNNRLRSNTLRNEPTVATYGSASAATLAPINKAYSKPTPAAIEEAEPVETHTYNGQPSNGNGRKLRIQQQLHRLRTNSMRNEAAAGSYGSPIQPTSAPEIEKETSPLETHGYNGPSTVTGSEGNGRRTKSQLRLNRPHSKSMKNEPIVHSYSDASVSTPSSVQHSYHHQPLPEIIPALAEIEPEAEVEAEEVIVEGATSERSIRNRLRSNRGRSNGAGRDEEAVKAEYKLSGESVEYGTGSASMPEMNVEEAAVVMEEEGSSGSKFGHRLRSTGRKQPRSGVTADLAGTRYDPSLAPETEAEATPKLQPVFLNKH